MADSIRDFLIDERLSVYLMILKITPNLKGYIYLKDCAKKIFKDSTMKFNVNNKLLKDIAVENQESIIIVERALRHAIDVCSKRKGLESFAKFAKVEFYSSKPSPRELLCILVERVAVESNILLSNQKFLAKKWQDVLIA